MRPTSEPLSTAPPHVRPRPGADRHVVDAAGHVLCAGGLRRPVAALLGVSGEAKARLERAIAAAAGSDAATVLVAGGQAGPRRLVMVRPAREAGWAVVAVESIDGAGALLDPERLRELFQLSASEADIANGLLSGEGLAAIARRRGVQHETVRGQLKTVLRKVGVANQKQLAATLSRVAMALASLAC